MAISGISSCCGRHAAISSMASARRNMAQAARSVSTGQGNIAAAVQMSASRNNAKISGLLTKLFDDMDKTTIDVMA